MAGSNGSVGTRSNYNRLVSTFPTTTSDVAPFVARDVLDKVGVLILLALVSGVATAATHQPPAFVFVASLVAFGCGLAGLFMPQRAKLFAPSTDSASARCSATSAATTPTSRATDRLVSLRHRRHRGYLPWGARSLPHGTSARDAAICHHHPGLPRWACSR
jgi:hypothetical protein